MEVCLITYSFVCSNLLIVYLVESNDTLYGRSVAFLSAINELSSETIELILTHLSTLGEEKVIIIVSAFRPNIYCLICLVTNL